MAEMKGLREITAIAALLVVNAFFGISDKETTFIFPAFGQELFTIINFYTGALAILGVAFGLVLLYRHIKNQPLELPTIPSTVIVITNYMIFLIISYIVLTFFITGSLNLPIPAFKDFIEQSLIAADENTLAFIFLATIFPVGSGIGNAKLPSFLTSLSIPQLPWRIIEFGEYKLNFNPPDFNRFIYGLWGVIIITLLHAGAYSFQVISFDQFYVSLFIAGLAFLGFWWIKETVGFGACIAFHTSWNLVLISFRGSVF